MRIYVASSWRNEKQPAIVARLREAGHLVYDFRNPAEGDHGFHWSDIDPEWKSWDAAAFRRGLQHLTAIDGFGKDMDALRWAEVCVLVLPCGRSAHLEAGFAAGNGARTFVLLDEAPEPELMYRMTTVCLDIEEVVAALRAPEPKVAAAHEGTRLPRMLTIAGCSACGQAHTVTVEIPGSFPCPTNGVTVFVESSAAPEVHVPRAEGRAE